MVPLLLDGEWLELRHCPINTISRAAYEPVNATNRTVDECAHRSRWLGHMRATPLVRSFTRSVADTISVICGVSNLSR